MMLYLLFKGTPIEYGHVFLVPCGFKSLPQFRDASSLEMIMRMAIEVNNCSFRVFYDNIMQGASHPYFQVMNCFILITHSSLRLQAWTLILLLML